MLGGGAGVASPPHPFLPYLSLYHPLPPQYLYLCPLPSLTPFLVIFFYLSPSPCLSPTCSPPCPPSLPSFSRSSHPPSLRPSPPSLGAPPPPAAGACERPGLGPRHGRRGGGGGGSGGGVVGRGAVGALQRLRHHAAGGEGRAPLPTVRGPASLALPVGDRRVTREGRARLVSLERDVLALYRSRGPVRGARRPLAAARHGPRLVARDDSRRPETRRSTESARACLTRPMRSWPPFLASDGRFTFFFFGGGHAGGGRRRCSTTPASTSPRPPHTRLRARARVGRGGCRRVAVPGRERCMTGRRAGAGTRDGGSALPVSRVRRVTGGRVHAANAYAVNAAHARLRTRRRCRLGHSRA